MLCLLDAFDNVLIQPFMPNRSVIAFNVSILLQFAWLDMLDCDVVLFSPLQQLAANVFRSVINPNAFWSTPPLDDPVQAPDNPLSWQCEYQDLRDYSRPERSKAGTPSHRQDCQP